MAEEVPVRSVAERAICAFAALRPDLGEPLDAVGGVLERADVRSFLEEMWKRALAAKELKTRPRLIVMGDERAAPRKGVFVIGVGRGLAMVGVGLVLIALFESARSASSAGASDWLALLCLTGIPLVIFGGAAALAGHVQRTTKSPGEDRGFTDAELDALVDSEDWRQQLGEVAIVRYAGGIGCFIAGGARFFPWEQFFWVERCGAVLAVGSLNRTFGIVPERAFVGRDAEAFAADLLVAIEAAGCGEALALRRYFREYGVKCISCGYGLEGWQSGPCSECGAVVSASVYPNAVMRGGSPVGAEDRTKC